MKSPRIPLMPSQRPRQTVWLVTGMPSLDDCPGLVCDHKKLVDIPARMSRTAGMLCQVEWAWGPMHASVDAYYIHRGRSRWILWSKYYDDNMEVWYDVAMASSRRRRLDARAAGMILLARSFGWRREHENLDRFHWINQAGLLSIGDIEAVADEAWGRRGSGAKEDPT
jgi:hypothetical protein